MSDQALTYVEIDIDYCANTYGESPCTATLEGDSPTGTIKCFNCVSTCQDRNNFVLDPVTLRFAIATSYLPKDIECIPSLKSVTYTPGVVSLGENLGQRATLSVTFEDHPWSDTGPGFDKYHAERPYDPYEQGTFWGKFRARQPFLRGRPIRLIRGLVGQSIGEMETRHFVLESFDGPTPRGDYTLIAKDPLKLADGDRAQAPRLSNGFLVSEIDADDTEATLSPSGIGDLEYPAAGWIAIGGKEVCEFTRSGDTLTLTRAQFGTEAQEHDAQDRVQVCLYYQGEDPADIIADLLENYADVPSAFIPLSAWKNETTTFNRRLYTALIAEPTSVNELCSELVEQAALAVWWSDTAQQIRLQVLRAILTTAARFTPETWLEGSLTTREQHDKRLSQVWTYFGQRNPLESRDDPDNYRSVAATVDLEKQTDYGAASIKKIFSRWIPAFGRTVATRLNAILLGRFADPPRRFNFSLFRGESVSLGGGYRLEAWPFQDATGAAVDAPIQVTRVKPEADRLEVEAEEMLFLALDEEDEDNRVIIIDSNVNNINLRNVYNTLYPTPVAEDEVTCIVETGVIVGSASTADPAFDVGDWPADVVIKLIVNGRIQGKGGKGGGGSGPVTGYHAEDGGTALYTRYPIDLDVASGQIWGGGGGGSLNVVSGTGPSQPVAGGGGGAGQLPGEAGTTYWDDDDTATPGTTEAGGTGGLYNGRTGGDGGGPGLPGSASSHPAPLYPHDGPGEAGAAIDGDSFVTVTDGPGDIRGAQIN